MMDAIFREEIASEDIIIYMDDILIATKEDLLHHRNRVTFILKKLQDNNLFLKPEKCLFHKNEVEYLGVIVGKGQVKMDPTKVDIISTWPKPRSVTQLRLFLGFGNYYKDFIKDYSKIAKLLHDMTTKKANWGTDLHLSGPSLEVFTKLKCLFTSYPVLRNSVTPLCLSSVHTLLTCYLFHQITAYVYYRPAFPPYQTSLRLSCYLDT